MTILWNPDDRIPHALIRELFTGSYLQDVEQIATHKVFLSLAQALFS